jgi:pyruvate/2-oxoglutarate dehydrogenase complex dihydrolipoamide acyltransferase (E2) component
MGEDRFERLDFAERWFRDGASVVHTPGGILSSEVDMSEARALLDAQKRSGGSVSYIHVLVRAIATVLTENPDLHQLTAGNTRLRPSCVDICVSISTESAVTGVLVVKDAGRKTIEDISVEMRGRLDQVRREDNEFRAMLRRWGWIVPFSFLRRAFLRWLLNRVWFRRKLSGTVQLTAVPTVDMCIPLLFNTTAILAAGEICERVIAVNGQPAVRPTMILTCCFDHNVWNGLEAARFLNAVKAELEKPAMPPRFVKSVHA